MGVTRGSCLILKQRSVGLVEVQQAAEARLGVDVHAAELEHGEGAAVAADPFLAEEDGTRRGELDQHRDDREERRRDEQDHDRDERVEQALGRVAARGRAPRRGATP